MASTAPPSGSTNSSPPINDYLALNSRVMVAALIILFVVVFFILSLHIYAKWFWRRSGEGGGVGEGRRRRRRGIGGGGEIYLLEEAGERGGLEKSAVEALPVFTYRGGGEAAAAAEEEEEEEELECAVCLSAFEEGEQGRLLPRCNHAFHTACIDMWFHSHSTCPLCRSPVVFSPTPPPPPFSAASHPYHNTDPHPFSSSQPPPTIASILSLTRPDSNYPSNHILFSGDHHSSSRHRNSINPHLLHPYSASSSAPPANHSASSTAQLQHPLALDMDIHPWPWPWHGIQLESQRYAEDMGGQQLWRSSSMSSTASSSSSQLKASQSFRMSIRRLLSREWSKGSRMRVFPAVPSTTVDSAADDHRHSIPSPSRFNHNQNQNQHQHQNNNNVAIIVVAESQPAAT